MPKVIFLKDVISRDDYFYPKDMIISFKKRDFGIVVNHKWFDKEDVILLSEFREKRINSIFNEDN